MPFITYQHGLPNELSESPNCLNKSIVTKRQLVDWYSLTIFVYFRDCLDGEGSKAIK